MNIDDFNFVLPRDRIASEPAEPRDNCKLMVVDRKNEVISHSKFFCLGEYLQNGDVLVFNDSKVIPARINFIAEGRRMEILLIRKLSGAEWLVIGKPGKHLKEGSCFNINSNVKVEILKVLESGERIVRFAGQINDFSALLKTIGTAPFPPYIGDSRASLEDYQTIYAKYDGSVAAPTAGLHFTGRLMDELMSRGVQCEYITLHVGPGTFMPVKTAVLEEHKMHSEFYNLEIDTAKRLSKAKLENRRIIAVGTTSVRVLESCFDAKNGFKPGYGETDIFIYPGYRWKATSGIITNFHLPKSTLLLLVSAFSNRETILRAYNEAIINQYRFYSFGDAMFIY